MRVRVTLTVQPKADHVGLEQGRDGHGDGDFHPVENEGHDEEQQAEYTKCHATGQVAVYGFLVHVAIFSICPKKP